jgi:hypothetical protein
MRFAYRSLVPVVLFISLLVSSCPFCGLTDWEIDENPCFFYPCSGGDTCFVVNDQPTCGNCDSDEDCTLACEDNRCVECLDASDCGDDAYCDGTCVFVGCDGNDDACAEPAVCDGTECVEVSCTDALDPTCLEASRMCAPSDSCRPPDEVTGCGGRRYQGGTAFLFDAVWTRVDGDACGTGAQWSVAFTAGPIDDGVRSVDVLVFPEGAVGALPLLSVVLDVGVHEGTGRTVETGSASVCIDAALPVNVELQLRDERGAAGNVLCAQLE